MQESIALIGGSLRKLLLPPPGVQLMPGIFWGQHDELFTPAYWAAQTWMCEEESPRHYCLGRTLEEEVLACLLGGHGIPAEVGLAAYQRIREIIHASPHLLGQAEEIELELLRPLEVGGRQIRYRFARQKARYVAAARKSLALLDESVLSDRELRAALMGIPGIGPKTSAWVVRNWRGSDQVAIVDVHILRAGRILGIFDEGQTPERHYMELERSFLAFAKAAGIKASILNSVMWMTMRRLPSSLVSTQLRHLSKSRSRHIARVGIFESEGAIASA